MAEMNMPAGFGGLMRYKEEYNSKIKMSPNIVILMIILTIAFIVGLNLFF
jgi:preprotein translocase subunit Sec61beta